MNILVIGAGGREHALCWAIAKSPLCDRLWCAPGNGGIAEVATCVALDVSDHPAVIAFARKEDIGLVVVGPEAPLVAGLVDDLTAAGIPAWGPSAAAARLEASKGFTKDLCARHDIPTAAYARFIDADNARAYASRQGAPLVVKADGLAAGKGVTVAATLDEALAAIDDCFAGTFGEAGAEVVIEEFMEGEEASFFVLCDGTNILPLATAQDHKRVGDGDTGPNTGGMGAYSPAPVMTDALVEETLERIVRPTVRAMAEMGCAFKGVLYAGLMLTAEGPKLVEYNARFGDPECQVLMLRLASDIVPLLQACIDGTLDRASADWDPRAALTVVMAAKGYPGAYEKGSAIKGLDRATATGVQVFHAGTTRDGERILANGGRVLNVTALGDTIGAAKDAAYAGVAAIDWPEGFCRSDIGWRALERDGG